MKYRTVCYTNVAQLTPLKYIHVVISKSYPFPEIDMCLREGRGARGSELGSVTCPIASHLMVQKSVIRHNY